MGAKTDAPYGTWSMNVQADAAFYNEERLHQSLEYRTPAVVYRGVSATRA